MSKHIDWRDAPRDATHHIHHIASARGPLEYPFHREFTDHISYWDSDKSRWLRRTASKSIDDAIEKGFIVKARPITTNMDLHGIVLDYDMPLCIKMVEEGCDVEWDPSESGEWERVKFLAHAEDDEFVIRMKSGTKRIIHKPSNWRVAAPLTDRELFGELIYDCIQSAMSMDAMLYLMFEKFNITRKSDVPLSDERDCD